MFGLSFDYAIIFIAFLCSYRVHFVYAVSSYLAVTAALGDIIHGQLHQIRRPLLNLDFTLLCDHIMRSL